MSYKEREFGTFETHLECIDRLTTLALTDAVPDNRYAVRDVEFDQAGQLTVIERNEPAPITPDTMYREIMDRRPLRIIEADDPPRICEERPAHVKLARWFNQELYDEYREQVFEPTSKFRGLLNAGISAGELHFLVPRPVSDKERDTYHPENHEYLTGFALYDFYPEEDSTYRALHFVAPDFQKVFAARRAELCEIVAEYDRDPQQCARNRNINLYNCSQADRILLHEIETILWLSVIREQSLAEATHEYLFEESIRCSREMGKRSFGHIPSENWREAQELLTSFVGHLSVRRSVADMEDEEPKKEKRRQ